jgi:hypothetical protein
MLYTISAIVRRRLEQKKNPERRETIQEMSDPLGSSENPKMAPQQANS